MTRGGGGSIRYQPSRHGDRQQRNLVFLGSRILLCNATLVATDASLSPHQMTLARSCNQGREIIPVPRVDVDPLLQPSPYPLLVPVARRRDQPHSRGAHSGHVRFACKLTVARTRRGGRHAPRAASSPIKIVSIESIRCALEGIRRRSSEYLDGEAISFIRYIEISLQPTPPSFRCPTVTDAVNPPNAELSIIYCF